ncbi:MAG: 2-amino-4-hydroxy-6-hydroxymethyldihydropteridine diphosphokinase, partial [Terracidiphilus sp.]
MPIAYIGLGANLPGPAGVPEATLAAAAAQLGSLGRVVGRSSLYSTAPVGFADQPRFLNAVMALETELSPRRLLKALLAMERKFGRVRPAGFANGPRTLDLDILLYGDLAIREHDLEIPHPRFAQRAFVLAPLHEIAPQIRDPRSAVTVSQLFESLLPDPEGAIHAVVRVESDVWRAGACGTGGGSRDAARAGIR